MPSSWSNLAGDLVGSLAPTWPSHHRPQRQQGGERFRVSAIQRKGFIPGCVVPWYDPRVKVDKLSVSFDPDLGDAVRAAAKRSGRGLSGWLAEAAAARLRVEALAEFLDGWEAEHGELTADELARATAELGLPVPPRSESAA